MPKIGTIEKIEFTSGGAGNQWTTIDGVVYATWWDFKQGVRLGSRVEYETMRRSLWYGMAEIDCARIVRVLPEQNAD